MKRLTRNKNTSEMSMVELAHNSCFVKDRKAMYRDYDTVIDSRVLARNLIKHIGSINLEDKAFYDDDAFDEFMAECLAIDPRNEIGLIALFYRNLRAQANLYEALKFYENLEEQCIKENACDLRMILVKWGEFFRDVTELYEYRKLKEQGLLLKLPCKVGDTVYTLNPFPSGKMVVGELEADAFFIALCTMEDRFGKTVFLTKSEAEEALRKRKGEMKYE